MNKILLLKSNNKRVQNKIFLSEIINNQYRTENITDANNSLIKITKSDSKVWLMIQCHDGKRFVYNFDCTASFSLKITDY